MPSAIVIIREPASNRLQRMAEHLSRLAMEMRISEERGVIVDISGDITQEMEASPDLSDPRCKVVLKCNVRITYGA